MAYYFLNNTVHVSGIAASMFVMLDTLFSQQKNRSVMIHDQIFDSSTYTSLLYKSQWYSEWQQIHQNDTISSHVKISMISLIPSLSLKLVYHLNIFRSSSIVFDNLRKSSGIFGNSQKMFGNARLAFRTILENLWKSSESGRKSSENHQKRRHQFVYIIKRTLHVSSKI